MAQTCKLDPARGEPEGGEFGHGSWPEGARAARPSAGRSAEPTIPWPTERPKSPLLCGRDRSSDGCGGKQALSQVWGQGSERVPLGKKPTLTSTPDLLPPEDGVLLVEVRAGAKGDKAGRGGEGESGRACEPPPQPAGPPRLLGTHQASPSPQSSSGKLELLVCVAPTPYLVRAGRQPRPPRGPGPQLCLQPRLRPTSGGQTLPEPAGRGGDWTPEPVPL